jgi:hypothetical protein
LHDTVALKLVIKGKHILRNLPQIKKCFNFTTGIPCEEIFSAQGFPAAKKFQCKDSLLGNISVQGFPAGK